MLRDKLFELANQIVVRLTLHDSVTVFSAGVIFGICLAWKLWLRYRGPQWRQLEPSPSKIRWAMAVPLVVSVAIGIYFGIYEVRLLTYMDQTGAFNEEQRSLFLSMITRGKTRAALVGLVCTGALMRWFRFNWS